jgi:hypothetical protein
VRRIKTSGVSIRAQTSPSPELQYDSKKLDQGSSAQKCIERSFPYTKQDNQNRKEILDFRRTFNGIINTTKSGINAGHYHD